MKFIKSDEWVPADGLKLEENALETVRSTYNTLVVAGPGAGKTELLAQRACYLLQTNKCQNPRKILAISFKRDAAVNLKHRVKLRCGDILARRFDSLTFDAFAKHLLDRFRYALPESFRLNDGYQLFFANSQILDIYKGIDINIYNTEQHKDLLNLITENRYPLKGGNKVKDIAIQVLNNLLNRKPALINFQILMRLSEVVINSNPKIKNLLLNTYQYIFLDEFQDTTYVQYDFLKSCFIGGDSSTVFTAVGDDKQRIMLWANANPQIFKDYVQDMAAKPVRLEMNFRSAPRLVELQNYLITNLLNSEDHLKASPVWPKDSGEAYVYIFQSQEQEKKFLYEIVSEWITGQKIQPREICILVKQRLDLYANDIIEYFQTRNIQARDENQLQDLLTEEVCLYVLNFLYSIYGQTNRESKQAVFNFLANINGEFDDQHLHKLNFQLSNSINGKRIKYAENKLTPDLLRTLIDEIIAYAGVFRIQSYYNQYKDKSFFENLINLFKDKIETFYTQSSSILPALDNLVGKDQIPVMTVHKSKGLEYKAVIFVGLEDSAFWSFANQPDEDKCTFFVALSRAKEKVLFTFSKERKDHRGNVRRQSLTNVKVFFEALENSKVVEFNEIED